MDYTQWPAIVGDLFSRLSQAVTTYFPNIVGAVLLLGVGWISARIVRHSVTRLIARLNRLITGRAVGREMKTSGVDRMTSDIVGAVLFWAVLLFFVAAAMEALGLSVVTSALGRLAGYLPTVLAAALVLLAGLVVGNLSQSVVSKTASSAGLVYAEMLGRAGKVAVLLLTGVVALDQVGVDSTLLILVFSIVIGMVLGGLALAFALGARTMVSNIIASHYLSQACRVGQNIRVGKNQGRIEEIGPSHVILEAVEGRILVPAKEFTETTSIVLLEGSSQ
jgi:small-conductance mechanosensitive channel